MRYDEPQPGEWVRPVKRGYKLACCDCGLVHRMDFRHVAAPNGRFIQFRVYRENRATAMIRRHMRGKP